MKEGIRSVKEQSLTTQVAESHCQAKAVTGYLQAALLIVGGLSVTLGQEKTEQDADE